MCLPVRDEPVREDVKDLVKQFESGVKFLFDRQPVVPAPVITHILRANTLTPMARVAMASCACARFVTFAVTHA